jgi:transposase
MRLQAAGVQRVWAFDEGRFGLRVGLRQRWCPRGVRPPWVVHDRYEWLWLYAAVEPATGQCLLLLLPRVTKEWFAAFLTTFGAATAGERVGLVLDGSGSHRAAIPWPAHVVPLPLPRYSPELNPAEQVFRVLRPKLANHLFPTLEDLETAITAHLQPYWDDPVRIQRLTGYPWWTQTVATMSSPP